MAAKLVAIEGLPGCGKTTVTNVVVERLRQDGVKVAVVDIDTTGHAPELRNIARGYPLGHASRIMLFWVLRLQQHDEALRLAQDNDLIIADRYFGSTFAYDLYGNGVPAEVLGWVKGNVQRWPDATLHFLAPLEVVRARKRAKTIIDDEFAARIEAGYKALSVEYGWQPINAANPIEQVATDYLTALKPFLP